MIEILFFPSEISIRNTTLHHATVSSGYSLIYTFTRLFTALKLKFSNMVLVRFGCKIRCSKKVVIICLCALSLQQSGNWWFTSFLLEGWGLPANSGDYFGITRSWFAQWILSHRFHYRKYDLQNSRTLSANKSSSSHVHISYSFLPAVKALSITSCCYNFTQAF